MTLSDFDYQVTQFMGAILELPYTKDAKLAIQAILQQTVTAIMCDIPNGAQKNLQLKDIYDAASKIEVTEFKDKLREIYEYLISTPPSDEKAEEQ